MTSTTVWLAEITAYDPSGSPAIGEVTLRYCTGTGYSAPSAPGFYDPRIVQPALLTRAVFEDAKTFGASRASFGELVIANPDGELDNLLTYGYGRLARLLIGNSGDAYGDFVEVLSGVVEQPTGDFDTISFRFRDRQQELDLSVQPEKFDGTNSGATGIEGTANDIQGQPKPRIWGVCKNVSPVPLNTSALIYGCNFTRAGATAPVANFDAVYDNGSALTFGSDRASLAALQAAVIAAGSYDTCLAEGLIRLGSSPAGQITCDVTEGSTAADRRVAYLIKRLLLDAGVASGDINASDITALDTAAAYQAGVYVPGESTYRPLLDLLAGSVGAWYAPDASNVYRIGQIAAPSGTPAFTFRRFVRGTAAKSSEGDILQIERVASNDEGRGVPSWTVNLNHTRAWTVQSAGELAGSATEARRALVGREYRTVTASDASVQTVYPQAPELSFDTVLVSSTNAQTECTRRLTLYATRRDTYRVKVKLGAGLATAVRLGSVVALKLARFGLDAGKSFLVTGLTYDAASETLDLVLWG